MARRTIPASERAQQALDVADREVKNAKERVDRLAQDHLDAVARLDRARRRREYLAQNPDLPPAQEREADEDDEHDIRVQDAPTTES